MALEIYSQSDDISMKNLVLTQEVFDADIVSDHSPAFSKLMRHLAGVDYALKLQAGSNGRYYPRISINQPVNCQDLNQWINTPGELLNLSPQGLQIISTRELLNESMVRVNNSFMRGLARVCHMESVGDQVKLGCEFVEVNWLAKNLLIDKKI